jgi:mono/diheme cytochrome c family protein
VIGRVTRRYPRRARPAVSVALCVVGLAAAAVVGVTPTNAQQASPTVARGAQVFNDNCQICHGPYAQGRMGPPLLPLPPFITTLPRDEIVGELLGLIRGGIPGRMPRFEPGQISDQDAGSLVDWFLFVNSQPVSGRSFYEAIAPVEPVPNGSNAVYVAATRHTISFGFKEFYEQQGGAARFGNPLTEEYSAYSEVDGQPRTMQLFERARFEFERGEVRLSALGAAEVNLRSHFFTLDSGGGATGP